MKQFTHYLVCSLICLFSVMSVHGQGDKIAIWGKVINSETGLPIINHPVFVLADDAAILKQPELTTSLRDIIYTNKEGYYYDTISNLNKSTDIKVITYDCNDTPLDTLMNHEQKVKETSSIRVDFKICDLNNATLTVVDYRILLDTICTQLSNFYIFNDKSVGNIISRNWNFGDGSFSSEKNPKHRYKENGIYFPVLTIQYFDPITGGYAVKSIRKRIVVGSRPGHYHMGGHVYAGYFPIEKGYAFLFEINAQNELIAQDTAAIDTFGYYYFYQKPAGKYIIKTELSTESNYYNDFLPTYYGDKLFWQVASVIQLQADDWDLGIKLTPNQQLSVGGGNVAGTIYYQLTDIKEEVLPAEGIELLLLDEESNASLCRHSKEDGLFTFAEVPFGEYKLHAEVTGKNTEPIYVTINENNLSIEEILLMITQNTVTFGIDDFNQYVSAFSQPFPNPATHQLNLELSVRKQTTIGLRLINQFGQIVCYEQKPCPQGTNRLTLNTSKLTKGIYYLQIEQEGTLVPAGKCLIR